MLSLSLVAVAGDEGSGDDSQVQRCGLPRETRFYDQLMARTIPSAPPGRQPAMVVYRVNNSGLIYDAVFEKNADVPQAIASTQKILTAFLAEKSGRLDAAYTYTPEDDWNDSGNDGTPAVKPDGKPLQIGEIMLVRDYVTTLLDQSSNAAASSIANALAGNHPQFVKQMNSAMRALLGSQRFDSYFQNPSGLTCEQDARLCHGELATPQHSTANNLARLMGRIMADTEFSNFIFSLKIHNVAPNGRFHKGGATQAAGRTLVVRWNLPSICGEGSLVVVGFGDSSQKFSDLIATMGQSLGYRDAALYLDNEDVVGR